LAALVTAAGLFVLGNVAYMAFNRVRISYENGFGHACTAPAVVVRRFERGQQLELPIGDDSLPVLQAPVYTRWAFWVVFRVGEQEVELRLPKGAYIELEEGMTGLLTYKGERFLRFKPMAIQIDAAKPSAKREWWKAGGRVPRTPS